MNFFLFKQKRVFPVFFIEPVAYVHLQPVRENLHITKLAGLL